MTTDNNESILSRYKLEISLIGLFLIFGFVWYPAHSAQLDRQQEAAANQDTLAVIQKSRKRKHEILNRRLQQFPTQNNDRALKNITD